MRKFLLLFLVLALGLSACTLPQISGTTPTANIVATQVVQRLTQAVTSSGGLPTSANNNLTPTSGTSKTAAATPSPSVTTSPTQAVTATSTLTPTLTKSALTQTAGASPTATYEPGDPKIDLGIATLKDTFQKPTSWGLNSPYDDGHTRVSMTSGKLILTSIEANKWHGWRMYSAKVQNFYLEVLLQTSDCSGADQYGLVFRSPDGASGYWFGVTCDGHYTLESGDIYGLTEIIKSKTSPLIKTGSNQTNRLGVMVKDNKISLYANNKLLENVTSSAYTGTGVFGYYIVGVKTANFTYTSTELSYWKLP